MILITTITLTTPGRLLLLLCLLLLCTLYLYHFCCYHFFYFYDYHFFYFLYFWNWYCITGRSAVSKQVVASLQCPKLFATTRFLDNDFECQTRGNSAKSTAWLICLGGPRTGRARLEPGALASQTQLHTPRSNFEVRNQRLGWFGWFMLVHAQKVKKWKECEKDVLQCEKFICPIFCESDVTKWQSWKSCCHLRPGSWGFLLSSIFLFGSHSKKSWDKTQPPGPVWNFKKG